MGGFPCRTVSHREQRPNPIPATNHAANTHLAPFQRHWDFSSVLSAAGQRRDLIRAFLQVDAFPREWDTTGRIYNYMAPNTTITRVPTEQEIREILVPWRTPRWRRAALRLWCNRDDEEVWLRTYYGEDSDAKFRQMREVDEDFDPWFEDHIVPWTVLDDQALFNGDWSAVFDTLPELAGSTRGQDPYSHRHLGDPEKLESLRQGLRKSVTSALRLEGHGNDPEELKIDDVEAGGGMELQAHAVATFLLVADAEAFETEKLRLLYLDARGNIVREFRLPYTESWETRHEWNACKFKTSMSWRDWVKTDQPVVHGPRSVLGEKYRFPGIIGPVLYQID